MTRRRDEGAVLPLVLILILIGALVVIPLMGYAVAVLRSNTVLSDRTKSIEAAKGGVRVALSDPLEVFANCDGVGHPTGGNDPTVNDIAVGLSCAEVDVPVGPLAALGYDIPSNVVALQLGAEVPAELTGLTRANSAAVPPYPDTGPGWWQDPSWAAREWATLRDDEIWIPDLPRFPSTVRSSTPFAMPAGFNCTVFLPGHYRDPVDLSGNVYFASGVYYFEEPVTISDGADVVVGYGLADFFDIGSECADDIQVAANLIAPPATFGINGGGATWVFGGNGRLVIDDGAASGDIRIRFNQRYATEDQGGRLSIVTVNGDDTVAGADHLVTDVNLVPRSFVRSGETAGALDGSGYVPSSSVYTDKARLPSRVRPTHTATPLYESATGRGAILFTWDEVAGQEAGGARLGEVDEDGNWVVDPYEVRIREFDPAGPPHGPWTSACPAVELVVTPKPSPEDENEVSCLIPDLDLDQEYQLQVRAVNEVGPSDGWRGRRVTPSISSDPVGLPGVAGNVLAVAGEADDTATVSWDVPDNGGAPIIGYEATATRVYLQPQPNEAPVVTGALSVALNQSDPPTTVTSPVTVSLPVFDPNYADALTLTIDPASEFLAAGGAVTTLDPLDPLDTRGPLDVTIDVGSVVERATPYVIGYSISDPDGPPVPGTIEVTVSAPTTPVPNQPPVAPDVLVAGDLGVPMDVRIPAYDPDGDPLTLAVDTSGLDVADWTVTFDSGLLEATITTTAADGTYSIPYTVSDGSNPPTSGVIDVEVARSYETVGSCAVTAGNLFPVGTTCQIADLPDLSPVDGDETNLGYRFDVVATNSVGASDVGSTIEPYPLAFDGGGDPLDPAPVRMVEPWIPTPIIEIDASGGPTVEVDIPGYVSVPMGRLSVTNPAGDDIQIRGGTLAGTYAVEDGRAVPGESDTVPIGFENDFVLQRKVRIVATAGNITATAVVQVNEDGANYAINSWVVQ